MQFLGGMGRDRVDTQRERLYAGERQQIVDLHNLGLTEDWIAERDVDSEGPAIQLSGELALCTEPEPLILHPVVLENVPRDTAIACEEAFAPVVVLESYQTFADGLAAVNDSKFGLQAGVFTGDLAKVYQAYDALEVGGVLINQVPTFRTENMPYGGVKDSGFGREGVPYAMEDMTEIKSLIINERGV